MIVGTPKAFLDYIQNSEFDYSSLCLWEIETLKNYLDPQGRAMIDTKVHKSHATEKVVIYESNVDIEIVPIVRWLNSLKGIMTRWSCEGEDPKEDTYYPPYITIWVEMSPESLLSKSYTSEGWNDLNVVRSLLSKHDSVQIDSICTEGLIHVYQICFNSKSSLISVRSDCLAAGESDES